MQLSLGGGFSCALLVDKTVSCWGSNGNGQLGDGTTTSRATAARVQGLAHVVQISAGGLYVCALTETDELFCWGDNSEGELGDGTFKQRTIPTLVQW